MTQGVLDKQPHSEKGCCADFNKDIQEKRHKRRSKPQPWILLKFAIFLTLGIIGFATYVYVDRFCVPMLTRKPEAMGDRVFGSESLFRKSLDVKEAALTLPSHYSCIPGRLWCSFNNDAVDLCQSMHRHSSVLSYSSHALQVCLTSPGFAKDVRVAISTCTCSPHVDARPSSMSSLRPAPRSPRGTPHTTSAGHRIGRIPPRAPQPNLVRLHQPLFIMMYLDPRATIRLSNQKIPLPPPE